MELLNRKGSTTTRQAATKQHTKNKRGKKNQVKVKASYFRYNYGDSLENLNYIFFYSF